MEWNKIFRNIKALLDNELDRYRKADDGLLGEWFSLLYGILQNEEKSGKTEKQTWYQKQGDQPVYNVNILSLPEVFYNHRNYIPRLSEVSLANGILPENIPEMQSWRLELLINDLKGNKIWPETVFDRVEYKKEQKYLRHDIRFNEGRELTAYEVKFIKKIFDLATDKLKEVKN